MHGGLRLLNKHGMASSMFYEPNIILVLRFETTKVTNEALSGTRALHAYDYTGTCRQRQAVREDQQCRAPTPFSQPVQHTLIHNDTCQPKIALTYEGVKESCGLTRNLQPTHMGDTGNDM